MSSIASLSSAHTSCSRQTLDQGPDIAEHARRQRAELTRLAFLFHTPSSTWENAYMGGVLST
eukprot:245696-Rhodomonas_salina.2